MHFYDVLGIEYLRKNIFFACKPQKQESILTLLVPPPQSLWVLG